MNTPNVRPNQFANQRRSQRILLSVPLRVTGKQEKGSVFTEHTNTLIVSAHGALIQLREPVREGHLLTVKNVTTGEEMACRVVDVNTGPNGIPEIGVEFSTPHPRFWRVSFPPADWSARSPEAKRFATGPASFPKAGEVLTEKK